MEKKFEAKIAEWQNLLNANKAVIVNEDGECDHVSFLNGTVLYWNTDGQMQPRSREMISYIVDDLLCEPKVKAQIKDARKHFICNAFTALSDLYTDYISYVLEVSGEIDCGFYFNNKVVNKYVDDMYNVLVSSPEFKSYIVVG